jgi:hypothetical protein
LGTVLTLIALDPASVTSGTGDPITTTGRRVRLKQYAPKMTVLNGRLLFGYTAFFTPTTPPDLAVSAPLKSRRA